MLYGLTCSSGWAAQPLGIEFVEYKKILNYNQVSANCLDYSAEEIIQFLEVYLSRYILERYYTCKVPECSVFALTVDSLLSLGGSMLRGHCCS